MVTTTDDVTVEVPMQSEVAQPIDLTNISDEDFEKAQKTFQLGKKNLFLSKYDESVNNIGEACKIFSSKYGELDPHCAEIYYFYGRALLELARVENTVLGNALNGVPEDNETINDSRYGNPEDVAADEKKEISDKVIDALCDPTSSTEEAPAAVVESVDMPVTSTTTVTPPEVPSETPVVPMEATTSEKTATLAEGEEDEEEDDEEEDEGEDTAADDKAKDEAEADEISNLQRAWEMFELAKVIYTKSFNDDLVMKNKRVAECLLKLGEISIEQEIYEQACTDIAESIRMQEDEMKEARDERMLAESFYQLGLAQQFNNQFTEANDSFQKSINIMQLRIEKLKAKFEAITGTDSDAELEKTTIKDEIADMEALLPEMTGKLEEVTEQSLNLIKEAKDIFISSTNPTEVTNGSAPVNGEVKDITMLVKSKRKMSSNDLEICGKKTRLSGEMEPEIETTTTTPAVEPMNETTTTTTEKPVIEATLPATEIVKEIESASTDVETQAVATTDMAATTTTA